MISPRTAATCCWAAGEAIWRWCAGAITGSISETQTRETIRDVTFLHSGQFFAAAQKKYVYVYDNRGTEIHCLKDHTEVSRLDFLPLHFLLTSVGDQGVLRYQDTSYGKIVAQHRTKLGSCDAMTHNPMNGVSVLGHGNGTVTLWSPNMGQPLVKMLCHRGPIRPHARWTRKTATTSPPRAPTRK